MKVQKDHFVKRVRIGGKRGKPDQKKFRTRNLFFHSVNGKATQLKYFMTEVPTT